MKILKKSKLLNLLIVICMSFSFFSLHSANSYLSKNKKTILKKCVYFSAFATSLVIALIWLSKKSNQNNDDVREYPKNLLKDNFYKIKIDKTSLEKRIDIVEYFLKDAKILLHASLSKEYIAKKLNKFSTRQIESLIQQAGLMAARKYPEESLKDENLLVSMTKDEFDKVFVRAKAIIDEDKPWWKPITENKAVKYIGSKLDILVDATISTAFRHVANKLIHKN